MRFLQVAGILAAVGMLTWAASAEADTIVNDSFFYGNPAVADSGEYGSGDLEYQNPKISNFSGAWDGNTGTIEAAATGLTYPGLLTHGGSARFQYHSNLTDHPRYTKRSLSGSAYDISGSNFMVAGLMSFDSAFQTATGSEAFTGLLNAYPEPASYGLGLQWGFKGNGAGVDAVMRLRDDISGTPLVDHVVQSSITPGTHLFIMKVEGNYSGGDDRVSVWLNPADFSSEAAAGSPDLVDINACWAPGNSTYKVDTLVFNAFSAGANTPVGYDEIRFGETWDDVLLNPADQYSRYQEDVDGYQHEGSDLRSLRPTYDSGEQDNIAMGEHGTVGTMRAVLGYDLSDIYSGAKITNANLTMSIDSIVGSVEDVELRWIQHATSTIDEGEVGWNDIRSGVPWATPGGDFTTLLGTIPGFSDTNRKVFVSTPELVAAVQDAVSTGTPLEMILMAPGTTATNFVRWASDDASSIANHPLLTISYTVPEPSTWCLLLLGGLALFVWRRRFG